MKKVLGIGNALVDIIIKLNSDTILENFYLPKGSMQLVEAITANNIQNACSSLNQSMTAGGSAANTIHGLSKLGISTGFIGSVGQDETGHFFRDDMIKAGTKPFLSFSHTQTGRAISLVSPDSERTFATYLGAAVEVSANNLDDSCFKDYNILHLEGYLTSLQRFMETAMIKARQFDMQVSLDLASYNVVESNLDFLQRIVAQYVDIVFANEEEARAFTGLTEPVEALHEMAKISKIAVVKTGKKGSLVQCGNERHSIGIVPVKAVDTTGAGDLYAAGFLFGMINELPLDKCGNIGALLAANVIEELGAKISETRWTRIYQMLKTT